MTIEKLIEDCIACGACIPECPNRIDQLKAMGVLYVIDQTTCVECEGHYDLHTQCVSVCPVVCIVKGVGVVATEESFPPCGVEDLKGVSKTAENVLYFAVFCLSFCGRFSITPSYQPDDQP